MSEEFDVSVQAMVARLDPAQRHQGERDLELIRRAGVASYEDLLATVLDTQAPPDLRAVACWVLGRLPSEQGMTALLAVLADQSSEVRTAAVRALGEMGDERAVPLLITALLKDTGSEVRKAAAYALGLLGKKVAAEALVSTLKNQVEDPSVRGMVAEALSDLQAKQAVPDLITALRDPSVEVRFWSAFALGELGDPQTLPDLEHLAATDQAALPGWGTVSSEASEAIRRIRSKMGTGE